jgi:hypothetical protein
MVASVELWCPMLSPITAAHDWLIWDTHLPFPGGASGGYE